MNDFSDEVDGPISNTSETTPIVPSCDVPNVYVGLTWNDSVESTESLKIYEDLLKEVEELIWVTHEITNYYYDKLTNTFDIEIYGTPFEDFYNFSPQESDYSCAVAVTNSMLKSFGYDFGENYLADIFEQVGVYDPFKGTDPYLIDETINLIANVKGLEIQATEINNFSLDQLKGLLDEGNRILVGLDAWELYKDNDLTLNEINGYPVMGHAVQLTGIVESSNGTFVVINDPGIENGAGKQIPLDRFLSASDAFNFTAVTIS